MSAKRRSILRYSAKWLPDGGRRKKFGARTPMCFRPALEPLEGRLLMAATEFPIPTADSQPVGITCGPDGNLWFAELHAIGRITPAGVVTEFTRGLSPDSLPFEITAGPDGNLWFTEQGTEQIGRVTPAGVISEFVIPQAVGQVPATVAGITAGPDGNLWFTEQIGAIGRITPAGVVTVFDTTAGGTRRSSPDLITRGPDGNLWYTDDNDRIGRITPAGVITEFSAGITPGGDPVGIATGPDGNLWFTEENGSRIGRITPAGVITEFANGITRASLPTEIVAGPDGNLWFTEQSTDRIVRITPAGVVTEFADGVTSGAGPAGITVGSDGNIWFTEIAGNQIGRLNLAQASGVTTTTLRTSTATAVFGQRVTLLAEVTSEFVPTGTVTFRDGATVLGTVPVDDAGQAPLTVSLGVGNHALTASFAGTGGFANSTSAAAALTVSRAATTTALFSSANPAQTGQAVTFTARVAPAVPGAGIPTGTVTFKDGSVVLSTAPLRADGTAALTTSFATAGAHAITATYTGNANFGGSARGLAEQVSAPPALVPTTTSLASSANPAKTGQLVTFTATVAGALAGARIPTGTVTFFDGTLNLGTVPLNALGKATLSRSFSTVGGHVIKAVYHGSAAFAASSRTITEQVRRPSSTALSASANPAQHGRAVTFTSAVTPVSGTGTPTGSVKFKVNGVLVATVLLDTFGKARFTRTFPSAGSFIVTASYGGDLKFAASSRSLTEQVT
jgi:streptogramin lyase